MDDNIIGNRIKALRKDRGLNQEELAKILHEFYNLDTPRTTISRWENGQQIPETFKLKCLADEFNVSLEYLCGLSNYKNLPGRDGYRGQRELLLRAAEYMPEDRCECLNKLNTLPTEKLQGICQLFGL